jgi:hypothetical protein
MTYDPRPAELPATLAPTPTDYRTRPSYALMMHDAPDWQTFAAEADSPYEWGYECADRDIAAGLPELTDHEHSHMWHRDYAEGYRDCYEDARRLAAIRAAELPEPEPDWSAMTADDFGPFATRHPLAR